MNSKIYGNGEIIFTNSEIYDNGENIFMNFNRLNGFRKNPTFMFFLKYYPFKRQNHKMVKHTQTIHRQIADELFECV